MTYFGQKRACSTVALVCLLLSCAVAAPAKLDHLDGHHSSVSHHSRGGFRAGQHDTGIWGANLDRPNNLAPPRWGSNALETEVEPVHHHDHRGGSGTGTVLDKNFGAKAFNSPQFNSPQFNSPQFNAQVSPQFGASSNLNTFVSANSLQQGYLPPPPSPPEPQGYNYRAPQTPVNLYQPPPPPPTTTTTTTTTTTRRPPPPPPSGLYDLPASTNYRPVPVRVQPAPTPARTPAPIRTPVTQPPPQRLPAPPTGLYELPLASNPVVQRQPLHQPSKPQPDMPAMPYDFAYGVNDANSGNHYAREERHDGNVMRGQYSVLLPDGRTQVVKYYDDGSGFNAEVTYH